MLKTIIVDDEPLALEILESHIAKIPELTLVAKCNNALEAHQVLQQKEVDLMFLDIQMPQLTGTDFLKGLKNPPMVVFTTAYSNYAVEGFELNALDYLLKPISFERFFKAVNKAIEQHALEEHELPAEENASEDFVFIKADKKLTKVHYKDIIYIEGLKDYVIIYTDTGRIITLQTMKKLEEKLPTSIFKRIHRSFIVNLHKIQAVIGNMVEIKAPKEEGKLLPIGKNYRDELLELINKKRL